MELYSCRCGSELLLASKKQLERHHGTNRHVRYLMSLLDKQGETGKVLIHQPKDTMSLIKMRNIPVLES